MKKKKNFILLSFILLMSLQITAQNITVRGIVSDNNNEPIIGASIVIPGTPPRGTTTDANGQFVLTNVPSNANLVFSFVGMSPKTIAVSGQSTINVVLSESEEQLDEVVVIGYGAMRKTDLTGSIAQVQTKELTLAPVASFDEALAGRMAGVQVSSADGQPGGISNIVIRGANSLTQDNSPLYIIDGAAIEDPDNAALNPEEIASMTVLKDASATAIYGSRAANGVIIIETKKGVQAKPVISFNTSIGFQSPMKFIEMMSPYDFVKTQLEVNKTNAQKLYVTGELPVDDEFYDPEGRKLEDYRNLKGIDWQDMVLNTEPVQSYNLAIRGKSLNTSYSLSGSFYDQKGIILNTGFNRYQGRMTLEQELSKKVKIGLNANYTQNMRHGQQVNTGGGGNFTTYLLYRAWAYRPVSGNPNLDLTEFDGDPENTNLSDIRLNPVTSSNNEYDKMPSSNFSVNGNIDYKIIKGLTLKMLGTYNSNKSRRDRFYNSKTPQGSPRNMSSSKGINGSFSFSDYESITSENTLTFTKSIKKIHNIIAIGGVSYGLNRTSSFGFSTQQIPNEDLTMYGLDEGIPYATIAAGGESALLSYFARADYNYKSTYMLTSTVRADGSSKFSKENRWGYFPSVAIAWNMKNEKFLKPIKEISISKLRLSYGHTGNNRVGNYDYLRQMALPIGSSYSFNNATPTQGIVPFLIGNPDLKWETTKQTNIGYDLGLFKNRIELTIDLYKKITQDLLLNADLPASTGYNRAFKNIGSIKNQGLELSLKTINISTPKFSWTSNFNISFNENKIIALTRNQDKLFTQVTVIQNSAPLYISRIGYPAGMFYGYIFDGIYQLEDFENPSEGVYILKSNFPDNGNPRTTLKPGFIKYKDLNNDGTINSQDMTVIGRGQPLHYGGFTNNFFYYGFSLNVFFQWSYGNKIYNANRMMFDGMQSSITGVNQYATYNDRWTPENRSNLLFVPLGGGPAGYQSTRVLEDGSYLRLKTLSLSYRVPRKLTERFQVRDLSFRMAIQNLFTWTRYSGMDPEVSVLNPVLSPGFDYSAYPQARTTTFGINLTL